MRAEAVSGRAWREALWPEARGRKPVATGRRPDAIPGKPSPAMLDAVLRAHGLASREAAMVGDRLYTDVRMARDAGALAVLTLTGETKQHDVDKCAEADRPHLVIRNLGQLSQLLEEARDVR